MALKLTGNCQHEAMWAAGTPGADLGVGARRAPTPGAE